jgi:hypothetical protein
MSSSEQPSVVFRCLFLIIFLISWALDAHAMQGGTEPPWSAHRRPPPARSNHGPAKSAQP